MILLADIGNSATKLRLLTGEKLTVISVADAISVKNNINQVIVGQVGKDADFSDALKTHFADKVHYVTVLRSQFDIICGYQEPKRLGVDRWLAVLGAANLFPNQNCIIVDSGTATTIDGLTEDGKHQGGLILPGIDLMEKSIIDKAPLVFTDANATVEPWPTRTADALRSGCTLATVALIEQRFRQANAKVLLTGGKANILSGYLNIPHQCVPELVFNGLARFASNN